MKNYVVPLLLAFMFFNCTENKVDTPKPKEHLEMDWKEVLENRIKLLGHRNWVVVVDGAYPLQSSPGITTIRSSEEHVETLKYVKSIIDAQQHIAPTVYLDKEIDFVEENTAKGISEYRDQLGEILGNSSPNKIIHEDIIGMLDKASEQFNILIIKTDFTIPYTSVFFQLDCKYWNSNSERRLREKISKSLSETENIDN